MQVAHVAQPHCGLSLASLHPALQRASKTSGELRKAAGMERRAVPRKVSGRRGVATLVRSFPVAVAFPFIAASLRRSVEVCNNIADNLSKAGWSLGYVSAVNSEGRTIC